MLHSPGLLHQVPFHSVRSCRSTGPGSFSRSVDPGIPRSTVLTLSKLAREQGGLQGSAEGQARAQTEQV